MGTDIAHFAINADDPEASLRFYEALFGWRFEPWGPPGFFRMERESGPVIALQQRREVGGVRVTGFECTVPSTTSAPWRRRSSPMAVACSWSARPSPASASSSSSRTPQATSRARCSTRVTDYSAARTSFAARSPERTAPSM